MLEVFTGTRLPAVLLAARRALGDDACIVDVTCDGGRIEVVASPVPLTVHAVRRAPAAPTPGTFPDPTEFGAVLREQEPLPVRPLAPPPARRPRGPRPTVIALVGPTGAGKTTTLAKLATNRLAYGGRAVGFIGLDTYRVGAVEQLETYAELAGLPCEVAYDQHDLDRAMARLIECEVVLVDTPGRGPRQTDDLETVRRWLAHLEPDEVHLALPAGMMPQLLRRTMQSYVPFRVTHVLATKLDECPVDTRLFDVVARQGGAMRWFTDGQEVPGDLRPIGSRLKQARAQLSARQRAEEVFA